MKTWLFGAALAGFLCLSGCAHEFSDTEKGALGGAAVGAGTGALIGNQSGHTAEGALIGGAVGAAGGGLVGHELEKDERDKEHLERRVEDLERRERYDSDR